MLLCRWTRSPIWGNYAGLTWVTIAYMRYHIEHSTVWRFSICSSTATTTSTCCPAHSMDLPLPVCTYTTAHCNYFRLRRCRHWTAHWSISGSTVIACGASTGDWRQYSASCLTYVLVLTRCTVAVRRSGWNSYTTDMVARRSVAPSRPLAGLRRDCEPNTSTSSLPQTYTAPLRHSVTLTPCCTGRELAVCDVAPPVNPLRPSTGSGRLAEHDALTLRRRTNLGLRLTVAPCSGGTEMTGTTREKCQSTRPKHALVCTSVSLKMRSVTWLWRWTCRGRASHQHTHWVGLHHSRLCLCRRDQRHTGALQHCPSSASMLPVNCRQSTSTSAHRQNQQWTSTKHVCSLCPN